jgi:hypothetical protein
LILTKEKNKMTQNNVTPLVDVKLAIAYLAEQPIIHTEETIGNISKLKKMRIIHNGQPKSVPALSGNSFRGQLRDILADQLCASLSNQGRQRLRFENNDVYGILYSGGALGEKSTSKVLIGVFAEQIPSMRLMGAAFGNVMLPSKLAATHIIPCAEETQEILQQMYGAFDSDLVPPKDQWPNARNLLFNDGPLTRKDDRRDLTRQRFAEAEVTDTSQTEDGERQRSQMIYYVECIPSGTWLLQQLYSKFPLDQLELGCLFDGLSAFLRQPTLGGRSAAGYGQVRVKIQGSAGEDVIKWPGDWPESIKQAIGAYQKYLNEKQQDLLNTLTVKVEITG